MVAYMASMAHRGGAADFPGLPTLGHEDLLGLAGVAVLAEDPGCVLVRAGIKYCLAAQPGAHGGLIPDLLRLGPLRFLESVAGQPGDGEAFWPFRWIVGEERSGRVGELDAGRHGLPT